MGYRKNKIKPTTLKVNQGYEGETIEQKINRIVNNKEPITDGAPMIYTERKDGVRPEYDIRTDRFEIALDATNAIAQAKTAKREERAKVVNMEKTKDKDTGGEPTQGEQPK